MPLSQLFSGIALPNGMSDLTYPVGPSWRRVILWIVGLKDSEARPNSFKASECRKSRGDETRPSGKE
jgi:hypothetical protein